MERRRRVLRIGEMRLGQGPLGPRETEGPRLEVGFIQRGKGYIHKLTLRSKKVRTIKDIK